MDSETLGLAVDTATRSGMTPREALIHWELAGGLDAGEAASYWAAIAIDLAMQTDSSRPSRRH